MTIRGHAHRGDVFAQGFVCPGDKNNHTLIIRKGWWNIRRCEECGEVFSMPKDRIEPGVRPNLETVQAFKEENGVPVEVEGDHS